MRPVLPRHQVPPGLGLLHLAACVTRVLKVLTRKGALIEESPENSAHQRCPAPSKAVRAPATLIFTPSLASSSPHCPLGNSPIRKIGLLILFLIQVKGFSPWLCAKLPNNVCRHDGFTLVNPKPADRPPRAEDANVDERGSLSRANSNLVCFASIDDLPSGLNSLVDLPIKTTRAGDWCLAPFCVDDCRGQQVPPDRRYLCREASGLARAEGLACSDRLPRTMGLSPLYSSNGDADALPQQLIQAPLEALCLNQPLEVSVLAPGERQKSSVRTG